MKAGLEKMHSLMAGMLAFSLASTLCVYSQPASLPGPLTNGQTLLPNGWKLAPAGRHLPLGELPLNLLLAPDGKSVFVLNSGTGRQEITVIDLPSWKIAGTVPLHRSWLGMAFQARENLLLVSGGNNNCISRFSVRGTKVARRDSIPLARPWPDGHTWVGGLCTDPPGHYAFAVGQETSSLYKVDLERGVVVDTVPLPGIPYTCLFSARRHALYVSVWGGRSVVVVDPQTLVLKGSVVVDDHPCDMVESPDGRVFVACANTNSVAVIGSDSLMVEERLTTALFPSAPEGSTPNALALSPDGKHLAVANADNNCLALFDVSTRGSTRPLGFIPTGWYPTDVKFIPTTGELLVASAKGLQSAANPKGPRPGRHTDPGQYSGSLFKGVLSRIPAPTPQRLSRWTRQVYANTPHAADSNPDSLLLHRLGLGGSQAVKHVFYIIKENRTYDQVLGDMREGNGDSSLCLFPENVSPNHHALAREFVLFDNFYCDAEVSADGHNWSMGAYATDYVEKTWPTVYGDRGGNYVFEGGEDIVYPSAGYLWDVCGNRGVSFRSYGEFAESGETTKDSTTARVPGLKGHVAPFFRGWDLEHSDTSRMREWEQEFAGFERDGSLPALEIIRLPNDHTQGTRSGALSPRAYMAQNDLALGMLVERLSHSPYWKESAVFVVEDDAQSGPDHVDAHRSIALLISPFVKRRTVDHHMYSTSGLLRTMELLLDLPPMSQYDASALPMTASFMDRSDTAGYRTRSAQVDLGERNAQGSYGQRESDGMDFSREDAVPEGLMNRILWMAMRGTSVPVPPPVRASFVAGWEQE